MERLDQVLNNILYYSSALILGSLVGLIFGALILSSTSCSMLHTPTPIVVENTTSTLALIKDTVKSTEWLNSIFYISFAISIFAGLNGMKAGWAGVAASLGVIILKSAMTQTWVYWVSGVLLVISVTFGVLSVARKSKALKELVLGIQLLKVHHVSQDKVSSTVALTQSKDTKQIVNNIKADIKSKE